MTAASKTDAIKSIAELPRRPVSDVTKFGWRAMMSLIRGSGEILVTNHDEPEAVILTAQRYDAISKAARHAQDPAEATLNALQAEFDKRLAALQGPDAAVRLRSRLRTRTRLRGKLKITRGEN